MAGLSDERDTRTTLYPRYPTHSMSLYEEDGSKLKWAQIIGAHYPTHSMSLCEEDGSKVGSNSSRAYFKSELGLTHPNDVYQFGD